LDNVIKEFSYFRKHYTSPTRQEPYSITSLFYLQDIVYRDNKYYLLTHDLYDKTVYQKDFKIYVLDENFNHIYTIKMQLSKAELIQDNTSGIEILENGSIILFPVQTNATVYKFVPKFIPK